MPTFDTSAVPALTDGLFYCVNKSLSGAEVDLFNQNGPDPVPVLYNEAILAVVQFTSQGGLASASSYVILQTDLGDGNWIDVAGVVWTGTGTVLFAMSGGVAGNNVLQQTRAVGTAPGTNFSNQMCLGGRIRFVGKGTTSSSSSSSSSSSGSLPPAILCSIKYKLLGLR
jgi:hypothetical protein